MRRVLRLLPVVAVAALVAACVPTKPPPPNPCEGPERTVSPDNLCGWTEDQDGAATGTFVTGPGTPPAGAGSHQFVGADNGGASLSSPVFVAPLSAITTLNYSTLISDFAGQTAGADDNPHLTPYLTLTVDTDGDVGTTSDIAQLTFEPCYTAADCEGEIQPINTWTPWETIGADKLWWFDAAESLCGNAPVNTFKNLQDLILTACPNALVFQISLSGGQSGGGAPWFDFTGAVDQLVLAIGGGDETTFDFEA